MLRGLHDEWTCFAPPGHLLVARTDGLMAWVQKAKEHVEIIAVDGGLTGPLFCSHFHRKKCNDMGLSKRGWAVFIRDGNWQMAPGFSLQGHEEGWEAQP